MPCKGAVWQDLMMFALTPDLYQGADPDLLVRKHPVTRDVPESSIDVVVLAGYAAGRRWLHREDAVSMYHVACAEASLRWALCRAHRTNQAISKSSPQQQTGTPTSSQDVRAANCGCVDLPALTDDSVTARAALLGGPAEGDGDLVREGGAGGDSDTATGPAS